MQVVIIRIYTLMLNIDNKYIRVRLFITLKLYIKIYVIFIGKIGLF